MTGPQAGGWAYAAAAQGALTTTGLLPGISAVAVGARGARPPVPHPARVARIARLIAATMLCSGVVALTGFAIAVAATVWTGLIAGAASAYRREA
jgi:hypothetical protein